MPQARKGMSARECVECGRLQATKYVYLAGVIAFTQAFGDWMILDGMQAQTCEELDGLLWEGREIAHFWVVSLGHEK